MGSINNSLIGVKTAEIKAGLVLNEPFKSAAEIARNGGVITGNPLSVVGKFTGDGNSYIRYTGFVKSSINKMTITIKNVVSPTDIANDSTILSTSGTATGFFIGFAVNRLYFIGATGGTHLGYVAATPDTNYGDIAYVYNGLGATNADKLKLYINGVLQVLTFSGTFPTSISNINPFTLGAYPSGSLPIKAGGSFGKVNIFFNNLSVAEILAYYNGDMWNYDQHCVLWEDGKRKNYDPDNNKHLDASRAGNHMTFSPSAPTKQTSPGGGYNFVPANSQYMDTNKLIATSAEGSILVLFRPNNPATSAQCVLFAFGSNLSNPLFKIQFDETLGADNRRYLFIVRNADATKLNLCTSPMIGLQRKFIHISSNGLRYKLRENLQDLTLTFASGSNNGYFFDTFNTSDGVVSSIGAQKFSGAYTNFMDGKIFKVAVYKKELNQIQEIDAYLRMSQDLEV